MENINFYWVVGIILILIVYIGLFKTKIGKEFLFKVFGYGCYVFDKIREDNTDKDVIKTEYPGGLKIFGESIQYITTWGTSIQAIETKNFDITFWIDGKVTMEPKNDHKGHALDKEEQLKEIERFEKKFFKRVKVDKSDFYKTRMRYAIDNIERSK